MLNPQCLLCLVVFILQLSMQKRKRARLELMGSVMSATSSKWSMLWAYLSVACVSSFFTICFSSSSFASVLLFAKTCHLNDLIGSPPPPPQPQQGPGSALLRLLLVFPSWHPSLLCIEAQPRLADQRGIAPVHQYVIGQIHNYIGILHAWIWEWLFTGMLV